MALVGFGVQRIRVIPVELLRGGGMTSAPGTLETLGANAQIHNPTQNGQMAQLPRLVQAVAFGDGAPTAPAGCGGERALDGENEFAILGQLGLEDTHIRNIERDRDKRMLGHAVPSLRSSANLGTILPSRSAAQPLHLGAR